MTRQFIIAHLKVLLNSDSDDELVNCLQTQMAPTFISDNAVNLSEVPDGDLKNALRHLET